MITSSPRFRSMPRIKVSIDFGRVAGDRQLLGVAAELVGQVAAHRLDARLENLPHVVRRQFVAEPEIANHLLEHVAGAGTNAAVVEVDQRAVGVEAALDFRPVILVGGQLAARASGRIVTGAHGTSKGIGPKSRSEQAGGAAGQEGTSRLHFGLQSVGNNVIYRSCLCLNRNRGFTIR